MKWDVLLHLYVEVRRRLELLEEIGDAAHAGGVALPVATLHDQLTIKKRIAINDSDSEEALNNLTLKSYEKKKPKSAQIYFWGIAN